MCWRLRPNGVEGIIYDSFEPEYKDGDKYVFMNVNLTHFGYAEGFWPDHFVASTQTGRHFMLIAKDQINDSSMV